MTAERYPPNFEALETGARRPPSCIREELDSLAPTLKALGASYESEPLGDYDLDPPRARDGSPVPPGLRRPSFAPPRRMESDDMQHVVDRDMESLWTSVEPRKPGMWVELDLGQPVHGGHGPSLEPGRGPWQLRDGHPGRDERGRTRVARGRPAVADGLLYWSGPRVYPWEWGYRWETRFPPVDARFVRITQYEQDPRFPWVIAEAYVYEDLGTRGPGGRRRAGRPPAHPGSGARPRVRRPLDERPDSGVLTGRESRRSRPSPLPWRNSTCA